MHDYANFSFKAIPTNDLLHLSLGPPSPHPSLYLHYDLKELKKSKERNQAFPPSSLRLGTEKFNKRSP
jgi:hypothetical protein